MLARSSLFATTLSLAAACAPSDAPAPARIATTSGAIAGGYTSETDTAVVGILSFSGAMGVCTGALIMPNLVLTARHCVATVTHEVGGGIDCDVTQFGATDAPEDLYVSTLANLNGGEKSAFHVASEVIVPSRSAFCGNDMALIVLEVPIPAEEATPLVPRVDAAIVAEAPFTAPGEPYSAIGYGITGDDEDDGGLRRRRDGLHAMCVEKQCLSRPGLTRSEWLGEAGICSGDSGGPAIDLQGRVIGVASRGADDCLDPIYGSVHAWKDWIVAGAQRAADVGGHALPGWALGWPTDPAYYAAIGMACEDGAQCASGVCAEGRCTRPCNALATCPTGYACSEGQCALPPVGAPCAAPADCESGTCRDGACSRACDADAGCPAGWACDGTCRLLPVGQACAAPTDCELGICFEGRCTRACGAESPCPPEFVCDEGAAFCVVLGVGDRCGVGGDCRSGLCQDGYCTRACGDAARCPVGYGCDGDRCLLIPVGGACTAGAECGPGTCAAEGYCTRGCDDLAPCVAGYLCDQGQCALLDVGAACTEPAGCESGLCQGGRCTRACHAQAPCPDGYRCGREGTCAEVVDEGCGGGGAGGLPGALAVAVGLGLVTAWRRGGRARGRARVRSRLEGR